MSQRNQRKRLFYAMKSSTYFASYNFSTFTKQYREHWTMNNHRGCEPVINGHYIHGPVLFLDP